MNRHPTLGRTGRHLAVAIVLGALACSSLAGNPFGDAGRKTAGSAPAPAPAQAPLAMPPGTPSQAAQSINPPIQPSANGQANAPREGLDQLAISSVVGGRVLFRVNRGPAIANTMAGGAGSYGQTGAAGTSGLPTSATSSYGMTGSASAQSQAYTLLRAQDRKPFLVGDQLYTPVVDGFTVTLYRASDKALATPVWVGEPSPPPTVMLGPNTAELVPPPQPQQPAGATPPSVMPSAAFGSGSNTGSTLTTNNPNSTSNPGTTPGGTGLLR